MARLAGSARLLRAMNSSATLAHLLHRGSLTRADVRALTGLSKPTSSEMLRLLTDAGLAVIAGRTSGGPGPTAEIYAPNPDAGYAAAVSIREVDAEGQDGPAVAAAICDLAGVLRARVETPTDFAATTPAEAVERAVAAVCAQAAIPPDRLGLVQIAVAGAFDPRTGAIRHVHLPGWREPGVVADIRSRIVAAVAVDNDVNLAAVAERAHGVAAGVEGFALLWLDRGVGLAIDLGGTLLRGGRGSAGEIGYLPLWTRDATTGSDVQDLMGGPAVVELAGRHGCPARTPAEAVRAAVTSLDEAFLRELAGRIAYALAAVIAVLDPPLVVLAGAVAQAGGERLRDAVAAATQSVAPLDAQVAVTRVADDAVLLGALDAGLTTVRESLITSLAQPTLD